MLPTKNQIQFSDRSKSSRMKNQKHVRLLERIYITFVDVVTTLFLLDSIGGDDFDSRVVVLGEHIWLGATFTPGNYSLGVEFLDDDNLGLDLL
jgi:hypothetical protein